MAAPGPPQEPTPFGLLPAGQPLITLPTSQPSPTSFLYAIPQQQPSPSPTGADPATKSFSHLAVFLLPGVTLPPGTAASIYLARNPSAFAPGGGGSAAADFRFLGAVGAGKESAVFKLGGGGSSSSSSSSSGAGLVVVGISVEEEGVVAEKMQALQLQQQQQQSSSAPAPPVTGGELVLARGGQTGANARPSTQVLAQRIIQNAFNFLSGFSGQVGTAGGAGGEVVEVVPLRAFQDWWRKFENKIKTDPSFLEREQD
ncbi:hypothetical protein F5X99DRAFT_339718 [Biscogniauxia marginata]|nr:hypothetical protein F5X99DRAFT_339718 [Biscogniauxia marginata]